MPTKDPSATVPDLVLPPEGEQPGSEHAPPDAGSDEHGDAAHDPHESSGHHGKKYGHKHGDHGGHGDKWLVTYCDMITLLIAFFICILTFASKENGNKSHVPDCAIRSSMVRAAAGPSATRTPMPTPSSGGRSLPPSARNPWARPRRRAIPTRRCMPMKRFSICSTIDGNDSRRELFFPRAADFADE